MRGSGRLDQVIVGRGPGRLGQPERRHAILAIGTPPNVRFVRSAGRSLVRDSQNRSDRRETNCSSDCRDLLSKSGWAEVRIEPSEQVSSERGSGMRSFSCLFQFSSLLKRRVPCAHTRVRGLDPPAGHGACAIRAWNSIGRARIA